jgi:hypothetical protein
LDNAQLQGADLTGVEIWLASFPDSLLQQSPELPAPIGLPDTSSLTPVVWDRTSIGDAPLLERLTVALGSIKRGDAPEWADEGSWKSYIAEKMKTKDPSPDALARYFADLACSDSGTADGLARRAMVYGEEGNANSAKPLAEALLNANLDPSCEGAKGLTDDTRARLQGLVPGTARP